MGSIYPLWPCSYQFNSSFSINGTIYVCCLIIGVWVTFSCKIGIDKKQRLINMLNRTKAHNQCLNLRGNSNYKNPTAPNKSLRTLQPKLFCVCPICLCSPEHLPCFSKEERQNGFQIQQKHHPHRVPLFPSPILHQCGPFNPRPRPQPQPP